jgi:hypothetical protein
MGDALFRRVGSLRPLCLVILLPLLAAGCAGDDALKRRTGRIDLHVVDDWDLLVEPPSDDFAETVVRNAEGLAEPAGAGTAVVGCVAGGVALAVVTQGAGVEVGCVLGGLALYPVGYVLGFGAGALVGGALGVINLLADDGREIDMRPLVAAFEGATPRDDLAESVRAEARRLTRETLVSGGSGSEPGEAGSGATAEPGAGRRLTLTITRVQVTTTTSARPTSRIRLAVKGELTDRETGQRIAGGDWSYASEPLPTADLADDGARALQAELAVGWRALARDIVVELFEADRP